MDSWTLFLRQEDGAITAVEVSPDCGVDCLVIHVQGLLKGSSPKCNLRSGGKSLQLGANKRLSDYGVSNHSTIFLSCALEGGYNPLDALRIKNCRQYVKALKPLPGFITLTTEPDMISLEDDVNIYRAKMPCGHVIGPYEMTEYCQSLLTAGKFRFPCPHPKCEQEWQYFLVRHVACLSEDEKVAFETAITQNYMMFSKGYQTCPGCKVWCERANKSHKNVQCLLCNKTMGRRFIFCWMCLHEWPSARGDRCPNPACDGIEPRLRYLKACPTIDVPGVPEKVPSVRACPSCGILIEHIRGCKRMACSACHKQFCFGCLKMWGNGCGYKSACHAAPVQTSV